jgi:hypothetical protein
MAMESPMVECRASPLLSSILTNPLNLREKLLIELGGITSADLTTTWARQALTAKNSLTVGDASLVEEAFEQLVAELSSPRAAPEATAPTNDVALRVQAPQQAAATAQQAVAIGGCVQATTDIDKSVLAISAPPPLS